MQDESVQMRGGIEASLIEQKMALDALRNTPVKVVKPVEVINTVHASPKPRELPEMIAAKMAQEQADIAARDRMQGATPKGADDVPVPASLWVDIHGETVFKSIMGLPSDNAQTEQINQYILNKMEIGKMEDTKANYEKVLRTLLSKNNLSMNQQKGYLLRRLSLYLSKGTSKDEEDDLVLSILNIKKGKGHGVRR